MSITLQEIKDATCGYDTEGHSKAISIVGVHRYNTINTSVDPAVIAEFSSVEPIVSVNTSGEITWVSLKFISDKSSDLTLYFRALERYLEEVDNNTEEEMAMAFISLIPVELAGQYYINAINPIMWALEPESAGEDMRILRVAFFSEDISFLEADVDDEFIDKAFSMASEPNEDDYYPEEPYYGQSDRDKEFTNSNRFIADLADEEDDEEGDDFEGPYDDDEDEEEKPDRSTYVYH